MKTLTQLKARLAEIYPTYIESGNKSTGWAEVYELQKQIADILRPTVEVPAEDVKTNPVKISELKVGDLVALYTCVVKVDEISVYPNPEQPDYPTFVCRSVYHSGDLKFFLSYMSRINNGTGRGYRAHLQSNDRHTWRKVGG